MTLGLSWMVVLSGETFMLSCGWTNHRPSLKSPFIARAPQGYFGPGNREFQKADAESWWEFESSMHKLART
jgi:hypothetical protein